MTAIDQEIKEAQPKLPSKTDNQEEPEIILRPTGILHLKGNLPSTHYFLQEAFNRNWCEGLFLLSAQKIPVASIPTLYFWQSIADHFLTELCHLPPEVELEALRTPAIDQLSEWVLQAPPMKGGEYLNPLRLARICEQLSSWITKEALQKGGIHSFLKKTAPKWQQVGRVCLHLAENHRDPDLPFAFLATYSTGFGSSGKLKHLPLQKALAQYAGENNRSALIRLLTPIQEASKKCSWLQKLVQTNAVYQPTAWSAEKAYQFLTSIPLLEESGLSVRIPNWWKQRSRPTVAVTIDADKKSLVGMNALLNFNVQVALGDQPVTKEELQLLLQAKENLVCLRGQWVEVDSQKLQEAIEHWDSLKESCNNGALSFVQGMRLLSGAPTDLQNEDQADAQREWVMIKAGKELEEILHKLRDPKQLPMNKALDQLKATLRPYQKEGVSWLSLLTEMGLGACLADDMGLGKTIQVLSLLLIQKENKSEGGTTLPSLLILPASLLGNWKQEAERFAPSLRLLFLHPSETDPQTLSQIIERPQEYLEDVHVVVTTYSMLIRQSWLTEYSWNLAILDEAQAIKNASTKQSRAARKIPAKSRIALTGTPIENQLGDLWSIFDFLNPGLLGSSSRFKNFIKELQGQEKKYMSLRKLVSPYILRRMKTDPAIISDLPPKIEMSCFCQMTKDQIKLYHSTVQELEKSIETKEPMERRGLILQTLMRLKQICNHPAHFSGDGDYRSASSGKFKRLSEICQELAARQEKVLVFTQFREIIDPLANFLQEIFGKSGLTLHGDTAIGKRKEIVEAFQQPEGPPYLVLSLKAGGTGLNLTAASHVIHFDRWWNPAVENQATDRAFRIGQKNKVQVHKFITLGTIEEKIDEMISSKKNLASEVLSGHQEVKLTELANEEILKLVSLDIERAKLL